MCSLRPAGGVSLFGAFQWRGLALSPRRRPVASPVRLPAAVCGSVMSLLRSLRLCLVARTRNCPVRGLGPGADLPSLQVSRAAPTSDPFSTPCHLSPHFIVPSRSNPPARCLVPTPPDPLFPEIGSRPACFSPLERLAAFRLLSLVIPSRQGPFCFSRFSHGTHFTLGPGCPPQPPARSSS